MNNKAKVMAQQLISVLVNDYKDECRRVIEELNMKIDDFVIEQIKHDSSK